MPSLKDRDTNAPSDSITASLAGAENSSRQQPVALEVPITVNGARPLEGNDKREPFSESTKTVLVFGNGAVIRLGSAVAPGQLLFVTNERTKKEVICQVVRSKGGKNSAGYVEVEFTEPVSAFWGLRFPANHPALRSTTSLSDPESPTDEFLRSALETTAPAARKADSAKSDFEATSRDERFNTEPKSDERVSSRASLWSEAPTAANAPKSEATRLQERLTAVFAAEKQTAPVDRTSPPSESADRKPLNDTAAKLFQPAEDKSLPRTEPARATEARSAKSPSSLPSAFSDAKLTSPTEELKVPSWLQPLTHDADSSAVPKEAAAKTHSAPVAAEPQKASEEKPKSLGRSKSAKPALVLGSGLLGQSAAPVASRHSNKGLLIAVAAGLLVVAAGARWYLQQPASPALTIKSIIATKAPAPPPSAMSSSLNPAPSDASVTTAAPPTAQPQPARTGAIQPTIPQPPQGKPAASVTTENASISSVARVAAQPAVISERVPKSTSVLASSTPSASPIATSDSVEPESKSLSLDNAPLAKPKTKRRRQATDLAAPSLTDAAAPTLSADASLGAGLVPAAPAQPAAPVPASALGGDVKPARLLSSVQPVYPPIAKNQHVAGDVRIDALIDANGRVSSMKVLSGPPLLHQAAMEALRQWKYEAATLNGTAVPMHLTVTLQFHVQ